MIKAHVVPGSRDKGNKLKGARNCYMSKQECDSLNQLSAYTATEEDEIFDDPDLVQM
eukprot:CAMPEP_0185584998 /NCGR_PEP_ID=MMETSP0434-20130131/35819_1 /TAXON_ID=626734 ORGANISM="Favella taraikaensis, Strain Fe Narragansett Bay" /NCGR_SAMPLE_ID=MMETSP0434 /ASSEMBLY_ACC=CAM_ASM_000379 /LENGTH=56 /DNA_ID=CAMNT_0028205077 /DNA_START=314 /DNA_END=484 /DNA_ORIENTATION=-